MIAIFVFIHVRQLLEEIEGNKKYNQQQPQQRKHKLWMRRLPNDFRIRSLVRIHLSFELDLNTEPVE